MLYYRIIKAMSYQDISSFIYRISVIQISPSPTLKDEKKHHGAVDESSSELQFCKLDAITFVV